MALLGRRNVPDPDTPPRKWRALAVFWALVLALLGGGALALEGLGPVMPPALTKVAAAPSDQVSPEHVAPIGHPAADDAVARHAGVAAPEAGSVFAHKPAEIPASLPVSRAPRPGSAAVGPIAAPDPALLDPGRGVDGGMLPRIGADGRTPGQVYARGFTAERSRPLIGLVLAGIGMNAADSAQAIARLPAELTLAISPYAPENLALLEQARQGGHELLLSIPLEPMGFPLNDPGEHALLTGATPERNERNLEWALGRFAGYAGVTAALGGQLNGERFPMLGEQMRPVLDSLAARGLFYVDPRGVPAGRAAGTPPALPYVWNRSVDLIVDEPGDAVSVDAKLAALEAVARDKGSALGLVGTPTPVVLDRLSAWTNGLAARGFMLAPASALMHPPGDAPE